VTAVDSAGNRATAAVHVHFDDPIASMASDLEQARARVAVLEAQAASTQLDLARAQANFTIAQARFSAVEASANATRGELDAATAALLDAQRRVDSLEADVNATKLALADAVLDLGVTRAHTEALESQSNATLASLADAHAQSKAAAGQAAFATILGETGLLIAAAATFIAFRSRQIELKGPAAKPGAPWPAKKKPREPSTTPVDPPESEMKDLAGAP